MVKKLLQRHGQAMPLLYSISTFNAGGGGEWGTGHIRDYDLFCQRLHVYKNIIYFMQIIYFGLLIFLSLVTLLCLYNTVANKSIQIITEKFDAIGVVLNCIPLLMIITSLSASL